MTRKCMRAWTKKNVKLIDCTAIRAGNCAWTKKMPTRQGWYWYRDADRSAVLLPLFLALISLTGCISSPTLYPGTGQTPDLQEPGVTVLGEVTACQGAWCKKDDGGYESQLSLPAPPPGV